MLDCLAWFAVGMLAGGSVVGTLVWRLFQTSLDACEEAYQAQSEELVAVRSAVLRLREKLEADAPWAELRDLADAEVARWAS